MGNVISAIFHGCCGQDEDVDAELHPEHFHGFVFPDLTRDVDLPVPPNVDCFCPDSGTKPAAPMETERKEIKKKRKTKRKSKKKKSRTASGARTDATASIPVTPVRCLFKLRVLHDFRWICKEDINEIPRSRCRQSLRGYARTIGKNYGSGQ